MLANRVVVAQQLIRAQHELAKVHHAFALALVFVKLVDLDLFAGVGILRRHRAGSQAIFLAAGDEPLGLLGREALIVDAELFVQPLDGGQLVLGVQNLKGLRQVRQFPVGAQQAVAQAVKGANPHAMHIDGQHGGEAGQHFLGGFVGERHRHQAAGGNLARLQQPGNAGGQHPGFARAGARQNQRMLWRQGDGRHLLGVEPLHQGAGRGCTVGGGVMRRRIAKAEGGLHGLILGTPSKPWAASREKLLVESDTGPKILAPGFFVALRHGNRPGQALILSVLLWSWVHGNF